MRDERKEYWYVDLVSNDDRIENDLKKAGVFLDFFLKNSDTVRFRRVEWGFFRKHGTKTDKKFLESIENLKEDLITQV